MSARLDLLKANPSGRGPWKAVVKPAVKLALGVVVLYFAGRHVVRTWGELGRQGKAIRVEAAWVAAGMGLYLAGLVACGGGVAGTYVAKETSPDGETMSMSLELKGGKKAVMTMKNSGQEGSMSVDGTYSVEGEKVTVMLAGDPTVFTRKGGKLIANAFGEETVLVKQ